MYKLNYDFLIYKTYPKFGVYATPPGTLFGNVYVSLGWEVF